MAAQAGLCLDWSETPENTFCSDEAHIFCYYCYRNDTKFSERQVWANAIDPDQTAPEQSGQDLHCLLLSLQLLNALLYGKVTLFKF